MCVNCLHACMCVRLFMHVRVQCTLAYIADPGQCPAGRSVTVKLSGGQSLKGSRDMEMGWSMDNPFRYGAK